MNAEAIGRINELFQKSRSAEGLSESEIAEQKQLREEYLSSIKSNFKAQIENIRVIELDGRVTEIKKK